MFQRLFNWIKFKTLPPSVLFKNRLYIERDSKTRRITNNLGLTFRNSKWTDYNRYDVHSTIRAKVGRSVFITFVCLLLVWSVCMCSSWYQTQPLFNWLSYTYWALKDVFIYYLYTVTTLLITSTSRFVRSEKWGSNPTLTLTQKTAYESKPRNGDLKYLYYRWLTHQPNRTLTNLLNPLTASTWSAWTNPTYLSWARSCYRSLEALAPLTQTPSSGYGTGFYTHSLLNFSPLRQDFRDSRQGMGFIKCRTRWSFKCTLEHQTGGGKLEGLFYQTQTPIRSYKLLTLDATTGVALDNALALQLQSLQTLRFLYNYSTLHRSFLQNTHRLTMVKRLLYGTFFDKSGFSKNLWLSNTFNLMQNPTYFLKNELDLLYGNLSQRVASRQFFGNELKQNPLQQTLRAATFYEESFFWSFKRAYLTLGLKLQIPQFKNLPRTFNQQAKTPCTGGAVEVLRLDSLVNFSFRPGFVTLPPQAKNQSLTHLSSKDIQSTVLERDLLSLEDETLVLDLLMLPSSKVTHCSDRLQTPELNPGIFIRPAVKARRLYTPITAVSERFYLYDIQLTTSV